MATFAPRWHKQPTAFAPPFQGAPPLPPGANIPASHWNQGTWVANPHYNPQTARPPNVPQWMPGQAWGSFYGQQPYPAQQQQQQPSFNPYKRQPRAPSAEYLATKLSDNPLGLSNMIPAEELERQERERKRLEHEHQNTDPQSSTPWIWTPRPLDDDDNPPNLPSTDNQHTATNPNSDSPSSRSATAHNNIYAAPTNPAQPPDRPPSTQAPESFTSKAVLQPTFSMNIVRTPDHYAASPSPSRPSHRSSAPTQIYSNPPRSASRGNSVDSLASHMNHLTTSATPNPLSRHHSMPTVSSTNATSFTGDNLTDEPTSMFDVLSPLVIPMTPKPGSSRSGLGRHASVPAVTTSSLHPIPESSSTSSPAHSRSHTPAPNGNRHNSHQEPLQSPHAYSHSRSRSTSRPNSRHGSRPGSNSTSPYSVPPSNEQSPTSPTYPHSSGHSPHNPHFSYSHPKEFPPPSTPTPTPATNNHTSPGTSNSNYIYMPATLPSPYSSHTRPKPHTQQSSGTAILHSNGSSTFTTLTSSPPGSPTTTTSRTLVSPPPAYSSEPINNQSESSTTTKKKRKPSSSSSKRRRRGFWNRRGDHVTPDGYIVYAPHDLVYPPDLDGYPDGKDGGYMNEAGMMTQWYKRPAIEPPGGYESMIKWI